jgi:hypothetical protein
MINRSSSDGFDWKLRSVSKADYCPKCRKVYLSNVKVERCCKCGTPTEPCQIVAIDYMNARTGPGEVVGPFSKTNSPDGVTVERGSETE